MRSLTRPSLWYYPVAIGSVALAWLLNALLGPTLGKEIFFPLFFAAVMLSAWYGGWGPGASAAVLAALAGYYLRSALSWPAVAWLQMGVQLGVFFLLVFMTHRLRTARRLAELAQGESEAQLQSLSDQFRALAETAPCAIFIHQGAKYLYVNPAGETLTGYTRAELLDMNFWELVHPDFRELVQVRGRMRIQSRSGPSPYEFKILTKSGEERWVALGSSVITSHGQPTVLGVAFDVTERRQVQEVQSLLAAIVSSSDDAIFARNLDGIILSWNASAERIFGYTAAEMVGQSGACLLPPGRSDEMLDFIARITQGERIDHYDTVRARKDGRPIHISLTVSPIRNAAGNITGVSMVARDVTERKRAEQERIELLTREQAARALAESANRAKDEFLATVTHELRTPLSALLGWARLLRAGGLDAATAARALETIERSAHTQAQLIDDLLDSARIVTGKLSLFNVQSVDLAQVIQAAMDTVTPAAQTKGVRLETTLDPDAVPVTGDPERLQQVIWNLLVNAIRFTPPDGRVRVQLARAGAHAQIIVSDTGQGIPAEFLPYIFDPFRQAGRAADRRPGGLGLGLAIARHLVELHGGTIHAESAGEWQGATFTVKLPAATATELEAGL